MLQLKPVYWMAGTYAMPSPYKVYACSQHCCDDGVQRCLDGHQLIRRRFFVLGAQSEVQSLHLRNEVLLQGLGHVALVLGLGRRQCVQVEAQSANLATQLLAGLSPAGSGEACQLALPQYQPNPAPSPDSWAHMHAYTADIMAVLGMHPTVLPVVLLDRSIEGVNALLSLPDALLRVLNV